MIDDANFHEQPPGDRERYLQQIRLKSDLKTALGPLGGVIRQLRERGRKSRWRAGIFLDGMILVVVMGLGFYLGLPFWQIYADGAKRALQSSRAEVITQLGRLDRQRVSLLNNDPQSKDTEAGPGLVQLLKDAPEVVKASVPIFARGLAVIDNTVLIFGIEGFIFRSVNGDAFEKVDNGLGDYSGTFNGSAVVGNMVLIFGDGGAIVGSADGGALKKVDNGLGDYSGTLVGSVVFGNTALIFGEEGAITRSVNGGAFEKVENGLGDYSGALYGAAVVGNTVLIFGGRGAITRSVNGGAFEKVDNGLGDYSGTFNGSAVVGNTVLIFGDGGRITRSVNGGDFEKVESGLGDYYGTLLGSAVVGNTVLIFGDEGAFIRSVNGSAFGTVDNGLGDYSGSLRGSALVGNTVIIFGEGGALIWALKGDAIFQPLASATGGVLVDATIGPDGKLWLLANDYTSIGSEIIQLTDRWSDQLAKITLPASDDPTMPWGSEIREAIGSLPAYVQEWKPVADLADKLDKWTTEQDADVKVVHLIDDQITALNSNTFAILSGNRALVDFQTYMDACRGKEADSVVKLTEACLTARAADASQSAGSVWTVLSRQVPAGVLLMFMLVTFSVLYRYNLRLASFHDSRADVLEVLAQGNSAEALSKMIAANKADILNRLTLALGADRIDSGAMRMKVSELEIGLAETLSRIDAQKGEG